jgi:TnpA family transposase
MPRRRALTEAQLESLLALPVTEADLLRHWTLSDDDLVAIGRRRRNHNQLGFALQLCALRYPGRLLRPDEVIPEPALRFVADQLGTAPEALTTYAARFQTRYEQLGVLRKSFGFTDLTTRRRQILEWLLPMALATTNAQTVATALCWTNCGGVGSSCLGHPPSSAWLPPPSCWPNDTSRASSPAA